MKINKSNRTSPRYPLVVKLDQQEIFKQELKQEIQETLQITSLMQQALQSRDQKLESDQVKDTQKHKEIEQKSGGKKVNKIKMINKFKSNPVLEASIKQFLISRSKQSLSPSSFPVDRLEKSYVSSQNYGKQGTLELDNITSRQQAGYDYSNNIEEDISTVNDKNQTQRQLYFNTQDWVNAVQDKINQNNKKQANNQKKRTFRKDKIKRENKSNFQNETSLRLSCGGGFNSVSKMHEESMPQFVTQAISRGRLKPMLQQSNQKLLNNQ